MPSFIQLAASAMMVSMVAPSTAVEAAPVQVAQAEARSGAGRVVLIVSYTPGNERARRRVLALTRRLKLAVVYDMPRMSTIAVGGIAEASADRGIAAYRKITGVTIARRSESYQLQGAASPQ